MSTRLRRYLNALTVNERRIARRYITDESIEVGQRLFDSDDEPALAYVLDGSVEVGPRGAEGYLRPGQVAGAEQVFGDDVRVPGNTRASSPTRISRIEARDYWRLRTALPSVAGVLEGAAMDTLAGRLVALDKHIIESARVLLRERDTEGDRDLPFLGELYDQGIVFAAPKVAGSVDASRLFGGSDGVVHHLTTRMCPVHFESGQVVFLEGRQPHAVYFLIDGEIEALARVADGIVARVGVVSGDGVVGLTSILRDGVHHATCIARTEVHALQLDSETWRLLVNQHDGGGSALRIAAIRALAALLPGAREQAGCAASCMRLAIHDRLYD